MSSLVSIEQPPDPSKPIGGRVIIVKRPWFKYLGGLTFPPVVQALKRAKEGNFDFAFVAMRVDSPDTPLMGACDESDINNLLDAINLFMGDENVDFIFQTDRPT